MNIADDVLFTREVLFLMFKFSRYYIVIERETYVRKKTMNYNKSKKTFFLSSFISAQIHHENVKIMQIVNNESMSVYAIMLRVSLGNVF